MCKWFRAVFHTGFILIFNVGKIIRYGKNPSKYPFEKRYALALKLYRSLSYDMGVVLDIQGLENIDPNNQQLLVSNHESYYDPFLVKEFSKEVILIAKKEIASMPFAGYVAKSIDTIFLDRENIRGSVKIIKFACEQVVKNNRTIWVYPEGTRSKYDDHHMNAFKPGVFKVAQKTHIDIVPMAIYGSWRVLKPFNRKPLVHLHILKPIPYEEFKDLNSREICSKVEAIVFEEVENIKNLEVSS